METALMIAIIVIALVQSIRVIWLRKRLAEVEKAIKGAKNGGFGGGAITPAQDSYKTDTDESQAN